MAYDKQDIYNKAIKAIKDNSLYFIEDVVAYIPCDKTTFYRFFDTESNEYHNIKDLLDENRVNTKVKMRKKWEESDTPALQMGLMKLIATESEAHRLNGTKTENVNENVNLNINPIEWAD